MSKESILFFDGFCNLCSNSVRFIQRRNSSNVFRFVPLQSEEAKLLLKSSNGELHYPDSIILMQRGKIFLKSTAVLHIVMKLRFPWPLLAFFYIIPRYFRDHVYDWIARNRKGWFGSSDTCYIPFGK